MAIWLLSSMLWVAIPAELADSKGPKTLYQPSMFQTLVNPDCSHCVDEAKRKAGVLRDDDRVLAWIRGEYNGGAIPYRWFLVPHRIISDSYGVFVYDPDADFVRAWPASYDFRFHGWRNGVMVMRHLDGTLFDCLTGEAFEGPRKGERLKSLPVIESDWGPWVKANPGTVAFQMVAKFQPRAIPREVASESRKTRPEPDPRLDGEERVFGLALGSESRAWVAREFGTESTIRDVSIGGTRALILWDGPTRAAAAYAPEVEVGTGGPVTLAVDTSDASAPWVDMETGSRWNIQGRAVSGPRKGRTLRWLPGVLVKWHAWAASHPSTGLERSGSRAESKGER